jgi:hypothetical protein
MGRTNNNIHPFAGDMIGKRQNVASHTNKDLAPHSIFMLYFAAVITLLVEGTNRHYRQYLYFLHNGHSPVPNVTEPEMFLFPAIIIQM